MRSDDDTTLGDPGTTPDSSAANSTPEQPEAGGQADPANPFGLPPTPPVAPWQPQPPAWTPPAASWQPQPPAWTPPAGPSPWQPPTPEQPPVSTAWQPTPAQQPPSAWSAQPGWPPSQTPQGWGGMPPVGGGMPPYGGVPRRRPSRLPQILVVVAACLIAFSGGLITDHVGFPATSACSAATAAPQSSSASAAAPSCVVGTPNASIQGASLYNEALAIVKQYYVGRANITDQQLLYGSIRGMVDALGDTGHSTYLTPQEYAAWQQSLAANVAGIGVMMSNNNGIFTIDRVIPGTPAEAAGVKAGDVIVAVDGASTANMTFDEMAGKIRGAAGTSVTITVLHVGSTTPVDIKITREDIAVPLADWSMIPGTHIADISLAEFAQGAADQLQTKITAATKAGATSIILDLRGNPGGYASEAQDVASEFLPSGVVYIQQDANGNNTEINVNSSRIHNSLPLVVLVDHNSASSSEIVAGALQDHGRAKIVGVPTFGTGTVLQQFPLSDGSVIILGTSWWLTPNGHRIFGVGITPDQKVQMPAGVFPTYPTDITPLSSSQFAASTDAQLLAAVKDLSN